MKTINQTISELYPSSMNNAGRIIRGWIDTMQMNPSESLNQQVEALTGFGADYKAGDEGMERELTNN